MIYILIYICKLQSQHAIFFKHNICKYVHINVLDKIVKVRRGDDGE